MVHVDTPVDACREWNAARPAEGAFSEAIFEDLAGRCGTAAGLEDAALGAPLLRSPAGRRGRGPQQADVLCFSHLFAVLPLLFYTKLFTAAHSCRCSCPAPAPGLSGQTRATDGTRLCSRSAPS